MNYYKLESADVDKIFLEKQAVICKAVIPKSIYDGLKSGDKIVIQLSTRSKYMGIIKSFDFNISNNVAKGYIEIIRL
jgi:hypothetical protein